MTNLPKQWKGITQDFNEIESMSEDSCLVCLSQKEVAILLGALVPFQWRTRWTSLPNNENLDFIDDLIGKLMTCERVVEDVTYENCLFSIKYSDEELPLVFADIRGCIVQTIVDETIDDPPYDRTDGQYDDAIANDLDCLWGACLQVTKFMILQSVRAIDFIESVVGVANQAQDIMALFPVGQLYKVSTELIGAAGELTVLVIRDYLTNPNTESDMACSLFCYWRSIQPSAPYVWDDAIWEAWRETDYFSPVNVAANPQRFFLKTVVVAQGTLRAAQQFFLGLNDCSNDWIALCLNCNDGEPYCYTWLDGDGFVPAWDINAWLGATATYDGGNDRIVAGKPATPLIGAVAELEIDTLGTVVTEISVVISWLATRVTDTDGVNFFLDNVSVQDTDIGASGTSVTITYTPSEPEFVNIIKLQFASGGNDQADAAFLYVEKLTINGAGVNPFGTDNC